MKLQVLPILALALSIPLFAQAPPDGGVAAKTDGGQAKADPNALPEMTDKEKLTNENLNLKFILTQQAINNSNLGKQLASLQKQYQDFANALTAEHPGFVFNKQTAKFEKAPPKESPAKNEKK
jgi:hypothetical protein